MNKTEETQFIEFLTKIQGTRNLRELREKIGELYRVLDNDRETKLSNPENENGGEIGSSRYRLKLELNQIRESQTIERARYYLNRLLKSFTESRNNGINEINLRRWKEYDEIITDSLWIFDKRDSSGAHLGWYWGNFVPQIPHQVILRYTKKGDWVLDPFAGSGTTLIECIRLGRNGIGVEINGETVRKASKLIAKEPNRFGTRSVFVKGDSTKTDFKKLFRENGINKAQLIIMHPPYYDIIKFSDEARDLSNAASIDDFMKMFKLVVSNSYDALQDGRYMVLVAGDKYQGKEWIPLGFQMMNAVLERGYSLIGIIAKNFEDTRAKRNRKELWRYRALAGGFYVFKHEYIFIFRKRQKESASSD
ncbi:MAG: TRM11 family SAM-dependent methyltransferase [Thermoplasmata archaeon]